MLNLYRFTNPVVRPVFSGILLFFFLFASGPFEGFGQTWSKNLSSPGSSTDVGFGSNTSLRTQYLYTSADLGSPVPGAIDRIFFKVAAGSGSSVTFSNLQVRLGFTTLTAFPTNGTQFLTGLTPVFSAASHTINAPAAADAFVPLNLNNLFYYPGNVTLVVEVTYSSAVKTGAFATLYSTLLPPSHKKIYANTQTAGTGLPTGAWQDFGFSYVTGNVPAPTNDLCAGAIVRTPGTACVPEVFTCIGASQNLSPVDCGGVSSQAKEVWFAFTATGPGDSVIVNSLGGFDPVLELLSGSCGTPSSLVSLDCSDDLSFSDATERVGPGNLTPGQTYLVRVYGYNGLEGSFSICFRRGAQAPANDNCTSAIALTSSLTCNPVAGSTQAATQSLAPATCGGLVSSGANDVWYSFTALGSGDSVIVIPAAGYDPVVQVFSGTCSALTSLGCADEFSASVTEKYAPGTLIAGQVYRVRVYGWQGSTGSFSICVKGAGTPPSGPVNDACSTAVAVTPSLTCAGTVYSSVGATQSLAPVNCNSFTSSSAQDIWFSFVASGSGDSVIVDPSGTFDPIVQLFSGTCSGLVNVDCSDNPDLTTATEWISTGTLIPGTTYYVRVYGWAGATGSFSFCVRKPSLIPANNECSGGVLLTSLLTCNPQNFSSQGATESFPASNCNGAASAGALDVWFSFGALAQSDTVIVTPSAGFNPVVELFGGFCTNPSFLACSNNPVNPLATEKLVAGTLTPGLIYYVRVYGFNGTQGSFSICVKRGQTAVPSNDNCSGAIALTPAATCPSVTYTSLGSGQSLAPIPCSGATSTSAPDVWFRFVASGSSDTVIVDPAGTFDAVVQLFSGTCSGLVNVDCADNPTVVTATEKIPTGTLVPGATYYFRVYGWAGTQGEFTACVRQQAGPANDNCTGAFVLSPSSTCNNIIYNNTLATQSLPPVSCNGPASGSAADVWFSFTASGSGDSVIVFPTLTFNPVVQLFRGTCSGLIEVACSDNPVLGSATEKIATGTLIPGATYYVRVYGQAGSQGSFLACIRQALSPPPVNDNCAAALVLTPSATCSSDLFSNNGATQSLAPIPCSGATSTSAPDVWFRFVASGSGDSVIVDPSGTFDPIVQLFSGTCSGLVNVDCADNPTVGTATEKISTGTLIPGATYYFRVYGWAGTQGLFTACIRQSSVSPPPANDNCAGAVLVIPSSTCTGLAYSNTGATQSLAPVNCNGIPSSSARDVWFSFTASNAGDSIIVTPQGGFNAVVQLYGGSSCNNLVPLVCSDNPLVGSATEKISFGGLSVGVTYRVRVYGRDGAEGQFSFCVKQPSGSPPANDNCSSSITLTPAFTCNSQTFTTVGATQSLPPTACGSTPSTTAQDVWFRFGPALTQGDSVIVTPIGGFNPVVEVFSGLCTNPTSIGCSNNPFNPAAVEKVSPGNLNLSLIYWVRVYGYNGSQGQFSICVKAATTGPAITNDNCATAIGVTVTTTCLGSAGSNAGATQSLPPASCNGNTSTSAPDVWYSFTPSTPADTIRVAGNFNVIVELFSGTCSGLVPVACSDGPLAQDVEVIAPGNLIPGQTYFFRIYGRDGSTGNFLYCVKRALNCTTTPGTFSTSVSQIVSNGAVVVSLAGSTPGSSVVWQTSTDNVIWSNALPQPVVQTADTFYITSITSGTYFLRAVVTAGACLAATSNTAQVLVSCATPLTNKEPILSGFGISGFSFAGLNNTSVATFPGGAFQNFRLLTGQACRGGSYPFTITSLQNNLSAKSVWIDFNNNGSFADAGENVFPPSVGTGSLSGNIQIPAGVATGTVRVRVMLYSPGTSFPSGDPCFAGPYAAGEIEEYSLSIGNAPTTANAGTSATICGSVYTLGGNTPVSGSGIWTVVSGSGTFSVNSIPNAVVSGISPGVNVYQWTISTTCSSSVSQVTITSSGPPPTPFAGVDQSVCGTEATLAAAVPASGTGLWTVVSGTGVFANPSNPGTTVTGLSSGPNVFRWTLTSPPCLPVSDEVSITSLGSSAVVAQAGQDQVLCLANATLNGNSPGSGTGVWTRVAGSGTILNPTSPAASVEGLGIGTNVFRWTITTGSCPPSTDDVSIVRQAAPSPALAGTDQVICAPQTQLSASAPAVGTGQWSLVSGTGQIANPLSPVTPVTGLSSGPNVFRWTVSNGTCASSTDEVIVTTNLSAVAASAGPDQVVCFSEATLSANNPGSGTGQWVLVSGSGTPASPGSPVTTVSNLGSGNNVFRWTITSPGCDPSSDEVSIFRNPASIPVAGPDQQICTGQTTLAAVSPSAGTGVWTLVSGAGTLVNPSDPATLVTGLGNGVNVFRWTVSNAPCDPVSDEVTITTNLSAVAANAGPDQSVCGFTVVLAANSPGSGTGTWTIVQGGGVISDPSSPTSTVTALSPGTNVFSWTINPGGACPPSSDLVTINAFNGAVTALAGADQSVCGNTATLAANNPAPSTGLWTRVSGTGEVVNPSLPNSVVINLGPGPSVFRWTISNAPCTASSDEVTLTITPSGLVAQAGSDQTVCGSTASLNAAVPAGATGLWTVVSGGAGLTASTSPVSGVTGLAEGPNVFLWSVTSGACSASDQVTVTREPNLLNLGEDTLLCEGASLTLNAGSAYTSYLWSDNSSGSSLSVGPGGIYWLQVVSANGCVFSDSIRVVRIPCTGVAQTAVSGDELRVFPNPSGGIFHVQSTSARDVETAFRVYSSDGKEVVFTEALRPGTAGMTVVDLRGKPPGLYLLESRNANGRKQVKLVLH